MQDQHNVNDILERLVDARARYLAAEMKRTALRAQYIQIQRDMEKADSVSSVIDDEISGLKERLYAAVGEAAAAKVS